MNKTVGPRTPAGPRPGSHRVKEGTVLKHPGGAVVLYEDGQAALGVVISLSNGHTVTVRAQDGWVVVKGDSTLTVRPMNERSVYVRPVGYIDPRWIPPFARRVRSEVTT